MRPADDVERGLRFSDEAAADEILRLQEEVERLTARNLVLEREREGALADSKAATDRLLKLSADLADVRARLRAGNDQSALKAENAALKAEKAALAADKATLKAEKAALKAENKKLVKEHFRLIEFIKISNARTFGAKSEKIHPHQISLFNDLEAAAPPEAFEDASEKDDAPKPPRRRKPKKKIDWSRFDTVVVEHVLDEADATCPECGEPLDEMGYETRHIVHLVPAHLEVEEHRVYKYRCKRCCGENARGEESPSVIVRAEGPAAPLDKSPAGSTLLAHVLTQKYVNAMPITRIADDLASSAHLPFSKQTIAGWVIGIARRYLAPLTDVMRRRLLSMKLLHIDETSVQVLKEPGRSPTSKSWMWLFASAATEVPLYVFHYDPARSRAVPRAFLEGFSGTVVTDGYKVYDDLGPSIRRGACAAHIRRKFLEALKAETPAGEPYPTDTPAARGFAYLERMFSLEREWADLDAETRLEKRKLELAPLMDDFEDWARHSLVSAVEKSLLHRALTYAIGEWPHLRLVLEDGAIPIDNNRAERAIRPFCCGRRQWLFSDTPHGAAASAAAYSLITTARANGLDAFSYLSWLLDEMPKAERAGTLDLENFTPYSPSIPDDVRAKEPFCFVDEPVVDIDPTEFDQLEEAINDWPE